MSSAYTSVQEGVTCDACTLASSIHANAELWKYLTVDPLFGLLLLCPTSCMHIYCKMYTFQTKNKDSHEFNRYLLSHCE